MAKRTPDSGRQLLQQDVGWNLEENIRDEEDDQRSVVFVARGDAQFFRETKDVCICDIHTTSRELRMVRWTSKCSYRSKKANRYMIHRTGMTCRSMRYTSFFSVVCGGHSTWRWSLYSAPSYWGVAIWSSRLDSASDVG